MHEWLRGKVRGELLNLLLLTRRSSAVGDVEERAHTPPFYRLIQADWLNSALVARGCIDGNE